MMAEGIWTGCRLLMIIYVRHHCDVIIGRQRTLEQAILSTEIVCADHMFLRTFPIGFRHTTEFISYAPSSVVSVTLSRVSCFCSVRLPLVFSILQNLAFESRHDFQVCANVPFPEKRNAVTNRVRSNLLFIVSL
jgi:hypothetical protein